MIGPETLVAMSLAGSALSAGIGVYSSIQNGKQQQAQANYQAAVAEQNQKLAEEQASAERWTGHEAAQTQRQKAARIISSQRAAAGASGAAVDFGSNLDLQADTAAQGELDAINAYSKGLDAAYNSQIQSWNYGNQASAYRASGNSAAQAGYLNAASTAIGGIADVGSTWLGAQKYLPKDSIFKLKA